MKPLFLSLVLFIPFALGARYFFVCENLQWCDRASLAPLDSPDVYLTLPNGEEVAFSHGLYSAGSLKPTRTRDYVSTIDSISSIIGMYEGHHLVIEGPVGLDRLENIQTDYRDIGLARAAILSKSLQRSGVSSDRLVLQSYQVKKGSPIAIHLYLDPDKKAFDRPALPSGDALLDSTALTGLRFNSNSAALTPTEDLMRYATELIEALNDQPALALTLTGHTDNRANDVFNDSLGYWRAEAVAGYFQQLGYDRPITVKSEGERKPVSDNSTEEGRFQNRRVEVTIN